MGKRASLLLVVRPCSLNLRAAAEALALRSQKDKGTAEPSIGSSRGRACAHGRSGHKGRTGAGATSDEQDLDLELLDQNGKPLVFPSELDRR